MQHQAFRTAGIAVEGIAQYGVAQLLTVHSQLMGPARQWVESDLAVIAAALDHFKPSMGLFA